MKNAPNIVPALPAWIGTPQRRAMSVMPSTSFVVAASTFSKTPGFDHSRNVTSPAVIASGLPDNVPAWYIGPDGATNVVALGGVGD